MAWQGLSSVYRRQGRNQECVNAALRAVSLLHRLPIAHFNVGVAMARTGEAGRAVLAFDTALRFQPRMVGAHRYLAILHRDAGDREKAAFHGREAGALLRDRSRARKATADRSKKVHPLPEIPKQKERHKILLRERPDPASRQQSGRTLILVSGLPRSGTSLMMQLLKAGGLEPKTDGERDADIDNPKGYYEWEAIKRIGQNPNLLEDEELDRKAIKCISMLLPKLPAEHRYKVIFMTRPIDEVVQSQAEMMRRLGTSGAKLDAEQLARGLAAHLHETRQWLASSPQVEFIEIDYPTLVRDPEPLLARMIEFIGRERLPSAKAMATVIDPALHRIKTGAG